jgi:hypothetical protein
MTLTIILRKLVLRGWRKIPKDREAWKQIPMEAKVLHGPYSQWRDSLLFLYQQGKTHLWLHDSLFVESELSSFLRISGLGFIYYPH